MNRLIDRYPNLQYDDDDEPAGDALVSVQPVDQGCVASLIHQATARCTASIYNKIFFVTS